MRRQEQRVHLDLTHELPQHRVEPHGDEAAAPAPHVRRTAAPTHRGERHLTRRHLHDIVRGADLEDELAG